MRVRPLVDSTGKIWRANLNEPSTFEKTETLRRRYQLRCSHLDGHRRRRRPRIAFAVRPACFRCAAALSPCTPPAYPRLENHPFLRKRVLMSAQHFPVFLLGFQSWRVYSAGGKSKFDRSGSKFADQPFRRRGQITKSVTLTTAYNRRYSRGPQPWRKTKWRRPRYTLKLKVIGNRKGEEVV